MKNFSGLLLSHGSILVDLLKELAVLAELHENVDLVVLADDLIDLGDVLMHQILLEFYLPVDGLELVGLILLHSGYLDGHSLTGQPMDGLLNLSKASFADRLS